MFIIPILNLQVCMLLKAIFDIKNFTINFCVITLHFVIMCIFYFEST